MDRSVDARRKANDISPHRQCRSVCCETIGWRMGSSTPDYGRKMGYWIDTDYIENEKISLRLCKKGSLKYENYERKLSLAAKQILDLYWDKQKFLFFFRETQKYGKCNGFHQTFKSSKRVDH